MKQKLIISSITALLLVCGWSGRRLWRAHQNIVSLHVRNVPVTEVVHSLELQTLEKIGVDPRLDARITLDVDSLPLLEVLNRVGEQAGGLAVVIHAVYKSSTALEKLETAVATTSDAGKLPDWTNVAPKISIMERHPDPEVGGGDLDLAEGNGGGRRIVVMKRDVVVGRDGAGMESSKGGAPVISVHRFGSAGGDEMPDELIIPERIVMETVLEPRLNKGQPLDPDADGAAGAAAQVGGRVKTFYWLRKSDLGFRQLAGMGGLPGGLRVHVPASGDAPPTIQSIAANAEREAGRASLSRYQDLTPEQRLARAREQQKGAKSRP